MGLQQGDLIQNLFNILPVIGWGENKIFNNTQNDIDFLYSDVYYLILKGLLINTIINGRWNVFCKRNLLRFLAR